MQARTQWVNYRKAPSRPTRDDGPVWMRIGKAAIDTGLSENDLRLLAKNGVLTMGRHYIAKMVKGKTNRLAFYEFDVTELKREWMLIQHRLAAIKSSKNATDFRRKTRECYDYETLGTPPTRPWKKTFVAGPRRPPPIHPRPGRKRA